MSTLSFDELSYIVRDNDLHSVIINSFLNGIFLSIVVFTTSTLAHKEKWNLLKRPAYLSMLLMYILSAINLAQNWVVIKHAFVDRAQDTTSTFEELTDPSGGWTKTLGLVAFDLNVLIADSILVWRCWVLWSSKNRKVLIAPVLLLLLEAAFTLWDIITESNPSHFAPILINDVVFVPTVQIATSLALTLLFTGLTVYRICTAGGHRGRFNNIIETIVESAVLYSLATVFYLTFLLTPTYYNAIPGAILEQVTGIAPALIIARVSRGREAEADDSAATWKRSEPSAALSALRFGGLDAICKPMESGPMTSYGATQDSIALGDIASSTEGARSDSRHEGGSASSLSMGGGGLVIAHGDIEKGATSSVV